MNWLNIILVSVSMSIDAMTVGAVDGITNKNMKKWKIFFIAFTFGVFQFVMPAIGYFIGYAFKDALAAVIPWIAFGLLTLLSLKSFIEWLKGYVNAHKERLENKEDNKTISIPKILIQGIATSIDALCIGFIYIELAIPQAMLVFGIIGITTFVLSLLTTFLGKLIAGKLEMVAGLIASLAFLAIAMKILFEYLIEVQNFIAIIIVSVAVGMIILLFFIYLALGNVIAQMNFGAWSLKRINHVHMLDIKNPYWALMEGKIDEEIEHENVSVEGCNKAHLNGFFYVNPKHTHKYILSAHGWSSSHLDQTIMMKRLYDDFDFNLLLIDQRAHATSGGRYCTMGDKESLDLGLWIALIKQRDPQAQIVLYGDSMGAATVLLCASRFNKEDVLIGVIADAPYVDAYTQSRKSAVVDSRVPAFLSIYPLYLAMRIFHHIDLKDANVLESVPNITIPTLLIVTKEDMFIPPDNTDKIYDALPNTIYKDKHVFPKGGHCLGAAVYQKEYFELVDNFISKVYKD